MSSNPYCFTIHGDVPLDEAEMTLQLAMLALEGIYGQAAVRLDGHYLVDQPARAIIVDGASDVGSAIVRVFTSLLTREFGQGAFSIERPTPAQESVGQSVAPHAEVLA